MTFTQLVKWLWAERVHTMSVLVVIYAVAGYLTHNLDIQVALGLIAGSGIASGFSTKITSLINSYNQPTKAQ